MRSQQLNLTTNPRQYFGPDPRRGVFMCRNTHATAIIYVQWGAPGGKLDGFPILAGDILTLDRGDLSDEIYLWTDTVGADGTNPSNILLVG